MLWHAKDETKMVEKERASRNEVDCLKAAVARQSIEISCLSAKLEIERKKNLAQEE